MSDSTYHIVGEVIESKTVPNPLNFNRTNTIQILVKDKSGDTYYGARPAEATDAIVGSTVRFLAEIRKHQYDETHFLFRNARKMFVELNDADS